MADQIGPTINQALTRFDYTQVQKFYKNHKILKTQPIKLVIIPIKPVLSGSFINISAGVYLTKRKDFFFFPPDL